MASPREEVPGLELTRFEAWFRTTVPGIGDELTARLLPGGRSNLTYEVSDGRQSWVVRRPPLGHVLATAHDMAREHRVMTALRDTPVPVPATYALCTDEAVLGVPFYVMERVGGTPYQHATQLEALGPERTRLVSAGLVDTLAALHEVDPAEVGLADFGRPEGFLARQVARWEKQLDASRSRALPAADELHRLLAADVPHESAPGIVHGDYRLENTMVDARDRVVAVLDWEMATLGDPLTDLALLVVYRRLGRLVDTNAVADASAAAGFLSEAELVERYAAHAARGGRGGRDLSRFGFYLALAAFKLAAVLEGIHYRHLRGQTVGTGFDAVGEAVVPLLEAGLGSLKEQY